LQIGFEIWTMQKDILFDNIYIGHSIEDAEKFAAETFKVKRPIEKAAEDVAKPQDEPKPATDLSFKEDPLQYVQEKLDLFLTIARSDPIGAVKFVPEVAGGIAAVVATVLALLFAMLSGGSSPRAVKKAAADAKAKAVEAKDRVASAAATGAETAKAEVTKRKGGQK
jgi:calnexin